MDTRNEIASNWKSNVIRPPGFLGKKKTFIRATWQAKTTRDKMHVIIKIIININTKIKIKKQKNIEHISTQTRVAKSTYNLTLKYPRINTRVVQLNVEGLSRSKAEIIGNLFKNADVLGLQETHIGEGK